MNPLDIYMRNSVQTASPLQQVILLYDRAILALKEAGSNIEQGAIRAKIANITKAQDIIRALDSALDFEQGGQIARDLHALYQFIDHSLLLVHARNDRELLEDLLFILETLKAGWEGIQAKV
ncbi:MAG: flagellar export chaperone FliS [Nitratiruptor sp.]|nr:flagellar export chaperone FliS [Nitratiruptor sp.]NPA84290.1 flagellar export chaperone FliS [Campylobacterota bacterium]